MTQKPFEFQPGAILHDVVVGAFRARGTSFDVWCQTNGMTPSNGRNATFGQSRGPVGKRNLERIIEAAGREFITDAYRRRVAEHYAQISKGSK
ncbi:MAG: hypothetical protein Q8O82_02145 [Pseudorhodobacter sp.]|nr:hypothetical protein [Pseudorhodobacter sp.]